ncbi:c-type cytochrome [Rouxiella sp. Mn2063]|uniref:c-type cytochrome n=1 Tax=Rouxiella sp. Mn2063 TaxID=3395262 RepID=UPI003BCCC34E
MKTLLTINFATLLMSSLLIGSPARADSTSPDPALLARGAYVAQAADCNACHKGASAGSPDYSGGVPIATPMGEIIGSNITPSVDYGIGKYSEEDFKKALTQGIRRDGKNLYPAMPYTAYQGMTNDDIHALFVWLKFGVQPVNKAAPETHLGFPWSIRPMMGIWNLFNNYFPTPVTSLKDVQLQRGDYLGEVLGHCSACHSPRNFMMGESRSARFSGGQVGGWAVPNITSDPISGVGGWSDAQLKQYLKTGHVEGRGIAASGMGEAVENSLSYLNDSDIDAIVTWLRQIPAVRDPEDQQPAWSYAGDPARAQHLPGKALFLSSCAACHRDAGQGANNDSFPALTHNSTTGNHNPSNLVMVILDGVDRQGRFAPVHMPGLRDTLSDEQIAQVANYVTASFGNPHVQVSGDFVAQQRQGGAKPLLLRLMPWGGGAALLLVVLLGWQISRKRAGKPQ